MGWSCKIILILKKNLKNYSKDLRMELDKKKHIFKELVKKSKRTTNKKTRDN
jgi:hypothetical protein